MSAERSETVTAIIQQIVEGRVSAEQGSLLLMNLVTEAELSMRNKIVQNRMRAAHA